MRKLVLAALVLALIAQPSFANTERKRNAERPDYDAYKRELALQMSLIPEGPMEIGKPVSVLLKLVDTKSGLAVPAWFLRPYNGHPFHLLLVDTSLTNYQHLYPTADSTDGLYHFTFTPKKPGGYKAWAHVISAEQGKQQFVMADLGQIQGLGIEKKEQMTAKSGDYTFTLRFDNTPKLGNKSTATITMADAKGGQVKPDDVYIAGFHDDLRTILKTQLKPDSLLQFDFKPTEPGFVKLFLYVTIGKNPPLTVPLGFTVTGSKERKFQYDSIF